MSGILIEEDLLVKYSIVDHNLPEGQKIHDFLLARAKDLAGRYIDFDKNPVTFVLSDVEEPNAFFAPVFDPEHKPRRNDYKTARYVRNPIPTPVICMTRGLLELVDNLDQLDFVLGHELTHWMMRCFGVRHNSKGEEGIADFHPVDLIYDAGGDPKQALIITEKISAYAKRKKEEEDRHQRRSRQDAGSEGVDWSSILDVHLSDSNRKTGIEACLTRLSHLIDERKPTDIDKTALIARYNDLIDEFLNANRYQERKSIGKLKLLVDCIEHLSMTVPPEEFFAAQLATLDEESQDDYMKGERRREIQKHIDAGYADYFRGPVIPKKYQQKIVNLAEGIIEGILVEREKKGNPHKPAEMNTIDLNVYLQNRAYQHIGRHGYPEIHDANYSDASGILYSYFFAIFSEYSRCWDKKHDKEATSASCPDIVIDIDAIQNKIRSVRTVEDFRVATAEYERLGKIRYEIVNAGKEIGRYAHKFDNLTGFVGFGGYGHRGSRNEMRIYDDPKVGKKVPWDNLVEIAKKDESVKAEIVTFLAKYHIEDFRITHGLPYVRIGHSSYSINPDGKISQNDIPPYEVDFAIRHNKVLAAYDYIKSYFDNEESLIERTCQEAVSIDDRDYRQHKALKDSFNHCTIAEKKIYDFVSMFNSLPEDEEREDRRCGQLEKSIDLIPERYRKEHPIPGCNGKGHSELSRELFEFDNPIFKTHFGSDYKEKLVARKKAQQQRMFDTAFAILQRAVDTWSDVTPRKEALKEKVDTLQIEVWSIPQEKEAERETKKTELDLLERNLRLYSSKIELAEKLVYNILFSIYESDQSWYHLQRLTKEQKKILADFVVKDEKGCLLQIFSPEVYEQFCDYLEILEKQTDRILSGNNEWTDAMQLVAKKYGYVHAEDRASLEAFVQDNKSQKYRECKNYAWYLHMFDTMKYLENNSAINIHALLIAMTFINENDRSTNRQISEKIVLKRYSNYRRLITESRLLELVSKAVDCPQNYEGLAFNHILETADTMILVRHQVARIVIKRELGYYDDEEKVMVDPARQRFLQILDMNINMLLKQAEQSALQEPDALEKMIRLSALYCYKPEYYSSEPPRESYLDKIIKAENRLKNLATLAENPAFWPDDILDHVKAFVFAKKTFLDDKEFEDKLLNDILNKLQITPSGRRKNECLYILLDKNLRAAYPETRDRVFDIYAQDTAQRLGKDDCSTQYQRRLSVYLKALDDNNKKEWDIDNPHGSEKGFLCNEISAADKYLLLRRVSDLIVSQERTSQILKQACQISLNSDDMFSSYLYGIGVDYLTDRMDKDSEIARRFIRFMNSKGEKSDCEDISQYIELTLRKDCKRNSENLEKILAQTDPGKCKILYENFWSAPLEARAVIVSRVLRSAVGNEQQSQEFSQHDWERAFDVVMDNLIHPADKSIEAQYARDIMHSYIKSRSDYERVLIISAMMVANRNIGADAGNIGKALRLFLENMGPAEIKLGQAIASHPDTPAAIKKELQYLKSAANMPARWTVYDWIKAENIPEEIWKNEHLGEIMGSASYYTSIALGEEEILRILRPEAREKAVKGFKVIHSAIEDLRIKEGASPLSYKKLTQAVQEMIVQAAKMSEIETDHDLGQQQYETAKKICDNVTLNNGQESFTLKVMDWKAKGQNWITMQRAKGPTFNALPQDAPEKMAYKKHIAKSYILFEMTNILSGKKFDHDRHGDQLSVDVDTNIIGMYDTGAMALNDPSAQDQRMIGKIIYVVLKAALGGEEAVSAFGRVTAEHIEASYKSGQDTQYLVEVKKGFLALGDFFKILDADEVKDIFSSINIASDVSAHVQEGITEGMSFFEVAQWRAFLAMKSTRDKPVISIERKNIPSEFLADVSIFTVQPNKIEKSRWLQTVFNSEETDSSMPQKPASAFPHLCSQYAWTDAKIA